MNPKDEIQKLIQAEMKKWEDYEDKNDKLRIHQADNFKFICALLNDLVASIEPEYTKTNILDGHATLKVGNDIDRSSFISWTIQPNFITLESKEEYWNTNLWQDKVNIEAEPGFKVQEKRGDDVETNSEFGTENDLINYLAQEIAKRVAFYRYRKNV